MPKKSLCVEYGKCLVEMGEKYPELVALEADLKESTQSIQFQQAFPQRYIEVGVAEQNMVGIAAGLALGGKLPVTHSFACFTSMRACEHIRTTVAYPKLNVKFVATHAGISAGSAGTTHHAIEDIAIMRSIPNMTVLAPGDAIEMRQSVEAALNHQGPVYIRLATGDVEDVYGDSDNFSIGSATQLRDGEDLTIIATGIMMHTAAMAADKLKKDYGIEARVLQMASIKPIDRQAIIKAALETGHIITVEEHNILGGLGGAVSEIVSETGKARVKRIGIKDRFSDTGSAAWIRQEEGLSMDEIINQARAFLNEK